MTPQRCRFTAATASALASRLDGALLGLGGPKQVFLEDTTTPALTTNSRLDPVLFPEDFTPPVLLNTTITVDGSASTITVGASFKNQGDGSVEDVAIATLFVSQTGSLDDAEAVDLTGLLDAATGQLAYSHAVTAGVEYSYWLLAVDRSGNSTQHVYLGRRNSSTILAGSSITVGESDEVVFSFTLASGNPVSLVELFVGDTSAPVTDVADVTALVLAGDPIVCYDGLPWAQRYPWLRVVVAGSEQVIDLGSYRTQDNTPPLITLGVAPAVDTINITYSVTDDSGQVAETYVHIGTLEPDAAEIRATGVLQGGGSTSHTFAGLEPATRYYVSVLAMDAAGHTAFQTVGVAGDNVPPSLDSYLLRAPTAAEGANELAVVVELAVSDVVSRA